MCDYVFAGVCVCVCMCAFVQARALCECVHCCVCTSITRPQNVVSATKLVGNAFEGGVDGAVAVYGGAKTYK